jgi:hypothetical protein
MEKEKKKRKYFIITKNKEECIDIELKEFFSEPTKYLEKTKFLIGDYYLNNYYKLLNKQQNNNQSKETDSKKSRIDFNIYNNNNMTNELFEKIDSKNSLSHRIHNKLLIKNHKRCISAFNGKHIINYDLTNSKKKTRNFLHSPNSLKSNISSSPMKSIHYEYKTPKEIIDIFKKFSPKDKKRESIKLFSNKIDDTINQKFLIQEKSLKINNEEKKNFNEFSKYLAEKCNKKEENLLLNKIENFNIKKQIIYFLHKKKLLAEKLGNNYWLCNLRRSKYNYKINYVNTGKNNKEPWEQLIDSGDLEIEYINNPSSPITIIKNKGSNYFEYIKKYPILRSFNKIKVDGKNLFNQEYINFISSIENNSNKAIKYKLYKDPQEKKNKSIKELIYKENYRPISRQKKFNLKRKII